jgi:hypothetical protein
MRPEHRSDSLASAEAEIDEQVTAVALAELRQALAAAGAPQEVLRLLDGPGSPGEIVQRLIGAGLAAPPPDSAAALVAQWEPLLERGTDPLDVELSGAEFLALLRRGAAGPDDLPDMLTTLVAQAEQHGGPAALAMLRALAVMAPERVRDQAGAAGDRLAAAGLPDRPWVAQLGAPKLGTCFGYSDGIAQEAVAITFRYGRKRHAVAVLIDYGLGGGVKDVWVGDRPGQVRAAYQDSADRIGVEFEDYDPAAAHAILELALSKPPCPVEPDQVEDVGTYLDLLRGRVALLAGGATTRVPAARPPTPEQTATVHRIKVTLRGSKPPIWRRLEVPSSATLDALHHYVQAAFGWEHSHLWVFETPQGSYGLPDPELGHRSAASKRLRQAAPGAGDRISYTYDFGDDWRHEIVVEDVSPAQPGVAYPRCLAGRRAGPPEDCGGLPGYHGLLDVLADPAHPEHGWMLEWLGLDSPAELDPAEFDRDAVNQALPARVLIRA